ncbi:MAG: MarR family winged helix-turn-helix transcriptional regulator [Acidimicrobiales bacterium]
MPTDARPAPAAKSAAPEPDDDIPVADRLGHAIKRAEQALMAAKAHALRDTGLSVAQYSALLALSQKPGISGSELARQCLVTPQTMATMLASLEQKVLVLREPSSIHSQVLVTKLSRAGHALVRKADRRAVAVERSLADAFAPDEVTQLRDMLGRASAVLTQRTITDG